jgi:hypothetical protein
MFCAASCGLLGMGIACGGCAITAVKTKQQINNWMNLAMVLICFKNIKLLVAGLPSANFNGEWPLK